MKCGMCCHMYVQKIQIIDPQEMILINQHTPASIEPLHTHEFIEIEYVISGKGVQNINGIQYAVKKGDVLFFNIGDSHTFYSTDSLKILNLIFYPSLFEESFSIPEQTEGSEPTLPNFMRLPGDYIIEVESLLDKIQREFWQKAVGYKLLMRDYVSILITLLFRCSTQSNKKGGGSMAYAILAYLEKNYTHVSLNEVAKYFSFSPTYFSKYFKKNVGMTFSKYIQDKRIQNAVDLITHTDDTIETICYKVGFKEKKQFYKLFKEYTGMTPNSLRKKEQTTLEQDTGKSE